MFDRLVGYSDVDSGIVDGITGQVQPNGDVSFKSGYRGVNGHGLGDEGRETTFRFEGDSEYDGVTTTFYPFNANGETGKLDVQTEDGRSVLVANGTEVSVDQMGGVVREFVDLKLQQSAPAYKVTKATYDEVSRVLDVVLTRPGADFQYMKFEGGVTDSTSGDNAYEESGWDYPGCYNTQIGLGYEGSFSVKLEADGSVRLLDFDASGSTQAHNDRLMEKGKSKAREFCG